MRAAVAVMGVSAFFVFGACGGSTTGNGGNPESGGGASETGGRAPAGGSGGIIGTGAVGVTGGSGGTGGLTSCFAAGTAIKTPHGEVAIERLRVGDVVLGYDEAAHRVVESPVTAVFVHPDQHPGTLTTADGRVLRVTGEHPIYLADDGRYVPAADLAGDERLLALDARGTIQSSIGSGLEPDASGSAETVYNITVAGVHNYFAEGVLVHNKSGGAPPCAARPRDVTLDGCKPAAGCINPTNPSGEHIQKNELVFPPVMDGGIDPFPEPPDAGPDPDAGELLESDAMPPDPTPPEPPARLATASVTYCKAPPPAPFGPSYLAFDAFTTGGSASFELYTGNDPCNGTGIGEIWLSGSEPPPTHTWTTQCVELASSQLGNAFFVHTETPGAQVRNPRFVTDCECRRVRLFARQCGGEVSDPTGAGSACY